MPLLKQCSFRQLKNKHNKINSYDINLLGALTFSEHWIHSHHEWRLILWFLGSPEPPVCSCSLSLQLTGRLPWVKTSVYLHRKWKPWEQKKHPVRTKSEEGKKVLIVCSSGHITTGPVPGVLQCPHLKAVAHTQLSARRETLPAFRASSNHHTFFSEQKEKYLPLITGSDLQPGLAWSYTLGEELQQLGTVCWHCPVHW